MDRKTVKRMDQRYLEQTLAAVDFSGVEMIAIDEFAIHKGHRYATVAVEASTRRVLWVGPGRGPVKGQPTGLVNSRRSLKRRVSA